MSLKETLASAESNGTIRKSKIRELPSSCCPQSEIEVYDFDAFAAQQGGNTPKSCDGVTVSGAQSPERVVLIEMKSIEDIKKELHFDRQKLKADDRRKSPDETASANMDAFEKLLNKKFDAWDFKGKFKQTNDLLETIEAGFKQSLKDGKKKETALYVYGDDTKFFLNFKNTIEAALKRASSPEWGTPKVLPCSLLDQLTD